MACLSDNLWVLMLSDFKHFSFDKAIHETHAHAIKYLQQVRSSCPIFIGMAMTRYQIGLWIYFGYNEKLQCIELCRTSWTSEDVRQVTGIGVNELCLCGGRIKTLRYAYVEGSQVPKCFWHIVSILQMLDKLHSNGYVHGDIRRENIVYCDYGKTSLFIDYDFAKKEGSEYPSTYNHNPADIPERHVDAVPGSIMKKSHDRYALYKAIVCGHNFLSWQEQSHLENLLDSTVPILRTCHHFC